MLNLINFIILFGAVQGLALGIFIFATRKNEAKGKYFLAIFSLILAYNGFETYNWSAGWQFFFFAIYTFTPIFALGPSLFFYIQSIVQPDSFHWQKAIKHYFLFFIQFGLRSGLMLLWLITDNQALIIQLDAWQGAIAEPLSLIFTAAYVYAARQIFKNFRHNSSKNSNDKLLIIKWLAIFFNFIYCILIAWAFSLFANYFLPDLPYFSYYYPTEIVLVIFLYWLGFTGYHQLKLIANLPKNERLIKEFSEIDRKKYLELLQNAMGKEKLYLDNSLTVNKLANHLKISAKTISAVLNQQLHKGFNEFVNEYRINEVKRQMLNPDNQHLTIAGIAYEAGFNSQATFQRVFKNLVGITPSEYLLRNRISASI
jgi:AraC-like DNA-binding protein